MARRKKIVGIFSDTHCGDSTGLTPPSWQIIPQQGTIERKKFHSTFQKATWTWFDKKLKEVNKIYGQLDIAFWVGDLTAGKGYRKGGNEIAFPDWNDQIQMASEIIERVNAKTNRMVRGTRYHTAFEGSDSEDTIARQLRIKLPEDKYFGDVNGYVFDIRHYVGGSRREHTKYTAPAAEYLTNIVESSWGRYPKANCVIRAHRHEFRFLGSDKYLAMVTPCLAGPNSFGSRICQGEYDFGFVIFEISAKGEASWQAYVAELEVQKRKAERL